MTPRISPCSHGIGPRARRIGWVIAALILANPLQASLETYGVFKGEHYLQANASAPGAAQLEEYGVSVFVLTAAGSPTQFIEAKPSGTLPIPIYPEPIEGSSQYQGQQTHLDAGIRDQYFPDGLVTFTLFDFVDRKSVV